MTDPEREDAADAPSTDPDVDAASVSNADTLRLLTNPIYIGIGPYPPIVERSVWLDAAERLCLQLGPRTFLEHMLDGLTVSFEGATLHQKPAVRHVRSFRTRWGRG